MNKIILTLILLFSFTSLTSCEKDDFDASLEPPLSERELTMAVPDFLTDEQQLLYRRAYSLYQHMFSGVTSAIEYREKFTSDEINSWENETFVINDRTYTKANGLYKKWDDFNSVIHSVFSDDFWNKINSTQVYIDYDGFLYYMDLERGSGYYYNDNYPDEFVLLEKSDTNISFLLVSHYSPIWPLEGETTLQRNERRKNEYEYIIEFPIELIKTEGGWRFNEFHTGLGDEKSPEEIGY